jgi:hypothetical protein
MKEALERLSELLDEWESDEVLKNHRYEVSKLLAAVNDFSKFYGNLVAEYRDVLDHKLQEVIRGYRDLGYEELADDIDAALPF